jgi:hypothetical protein
VLAVATWTLTAQGATPIARFTQASTFNVPGRVDSGVPLLWTRIDGVRTLVAFTSWGGIPQRLAGPDLEHLQPAGEVSISHHPGHGIWFESVIADEADEAWYAFYHHEVPADLCGRPDRSLVSIGAARSTDRGFTWDNLGIVVDVPAGSAACGSTNRFVIGGVGDVNAMVDGEWKDIYLFYGMYSRDPRSQGVGVARIAWADRDAPRGQARIWNDGAWLYPVQDEATGDWQFPAGTAIVPVTKPWHNGDNIVDAFWGPSIHWNTHLVRYVMLLNRAKDEQYNNDGIYVSYAATLDDPTAWTAPHKILNGGNWYPLIIGSETGTGTDKQMGQRARFFLTGRSSSFIEFRK